MFGQLIGGGEVATPNIVEVASLIGDPSRAAMLINLLGGKALPASERARAARVTPQTASSHLRVGCLIWGGLTEFQTGDPSELQNMDFRN